MIHGSVSNALKDKKRPHPPNASHTPKPLPNTPSSKVTSSIVYSEIINGQGKKIDPYMYVL